MPAGTDQAVLLGLEANSRLAGDLPAYFSKETQLDQPTLEIADLVARRDLEVRAIPASMHGLTGSGRKMGAARVRMSVVNAALESLAPLPKAAGCPSPYSFAVWRSFGRGPAGILASDSI
ncbi:MAG: hypothetical protein QE280_11250 [Caulobacter sp.]|jgi:hypothetical protein|nr:hypothetical protein [Caulobacter sp.]